MRPRDRLELAAWTAATIVAVICLALIVLAYRLVTF